MRTIQTKYFGPTNTKASRVKAQSEKVFVWLSWDYGLTTEQNHMAAATKLKHRLKWEGPMLGGHLAEGMVFVFAEGAYVIDPREIES